MRNFLRTLTLTASAVALATVAVPAAAQQVGPNQNAKATARVVRPLTLTWVSDLSLGNIILSNGTWTGAVVGIDRAGAVTCTTPQVTCTGTMARASYRVTGTQAQTVKVNVLPTLTLTNQQQPGTLTMNVDSPGTITLANSGAPGQLFYLGGSLAVDAATPDGTYEGTFNVTVEYN